VWNFIFGRVGPFCRSAFCVVVCDLGRFGTIGLSSMFCVDEVCLDVFVEFDFGVVCYFAGFVFKTVLSSGYILILLSIEYILASLIEMCQG